MALATVAALVMSTLVGLIGILLGSKAIKLSGEVASAQMRPLLQSERVWFGPGGDSSFTIENNGFGPLVIRQSVYVIFDEEGEIGETFVLEPDSDADDIINFLKLSAFMNDGRVSVGVPAIGSTLGIDKKLQIIRIAEHQQRSQFFRAQNKQALDQAVRKLGVCIVYDALDKRRQIFSAKGACEALKITRDEFRLKKL